jgi:hypothetical protein
LDKLRADLSGDLPGEEGLSGAREADHHQQDRADARGARSWTVGRRRLCHEKRPIIRGVDDRQPWYNPTMLAAVRVLWRSLVHLYDESLLMIRANLVWFVGSIPLFALVLGVTWFFVPPDPEAGPVMWPLLLGAFVMLVVPGPLSAGVYALTSEIVTGETPDFGLFWIAVRRWWKRGLAMFAIGSFVLGGLIFNANFYLSVTEGWLQAVSILWVYAILYWITLQAYLMPLLFAAEGGDGTETVPLLSLYKRAAILALANPLFSLVILFNAALTMILSAIALPLYPLIAQSYVAVVGSRALYDLRQKYFPSETEEAIE